MGHIHPTEEQFVELAAGPDGPVVMVNKLRFRRDGDGNKVGFDAYMKYSEGVTPLLLEAGGKPIWAGRADSVVIGGDSNHWDSYMIVEYPSRQAFIGMITSEEYLAIHALREEALEDSALVASTPGRFI